MHKLSLSKQLYKVVAALSTVLLSACSAFDVVNVFNRDSESSVHRDIPYGDHPRHRLDAYTPVSPADDAVAFIFFYGGGWVSGRREDYAFVARKLAALGHLVFIPDYRLYPQASFPRFVEDGAQATAFVLQRLAMAGRQTRPVFLMGHSAGAHIALLLALDRRYLAQTGHEPDELAGAIGLAGPYDFLPLESELLENIFSSPRFEFDSQPINHARRDAPPLFLAHGDRDQRVWLSNSLNLADAIEQKGGDVTLKVYPGVSHAGLMRPFAFVFAGDTDLLNDIMAFVAARTGAAQHR